MESFLKERETVAKEGTRFVVGDPLVSAIGPLPFVAHQRRERAAAIGAAADALPACGEHAAACEPSVRPVVQEGRVTALVVTCSCGKETEIVLDY